VRGRIAAIGLIGAGLLALAPAAHARDAIVESFDGTPIVTHFFPAPGLQPGERAPTIMIGHGWGGTGATSPPADFAAAGYNVLTWDARGFGGSGGTVTIDHPKFEGRDVSALIDYLAKQPEAKRDKPGDPRVGMSGGSYGGGIQFLAAARDHRVDVVAPTIAWHDLPSSLYPRAAVKAGWDLALIGVGIPTSVALGVFSPAGIQTGHQSDHFYNSVVGGLATGMLPASELPWFREHGPDFLLKRIKAPTLIAQGTVDTLFDLDQAHRNYQALKREAIPLKMMWFCGGHGVCTVEGDGAVAIGDSDHVQDRRLQWFKRHLKGKRRTRTGPAFEWIDQNGRWHRSRAYPLKRIGALRGSGSGLVPLVPGTNPTSGILVAAQPDPLAPIKVPIAARGGERVVGSPRLKLTYSTAGITTTRTDGLTHVYGQIVDRSRNVVAGNQATPIPIRLDGESHKISRTLTRIASVGTPAGYELQILGQSDLFDAQRAAGVLTVKKLEVSLPTTRKRKR
jgi:ABC-2 type transport system ATP-binding protein